jgi:hypothetical protein
MAEPQSPSTLDQEVAREVQRALEQISHGSVTLIVQDGRVVQIDTTRKVRLPARRPAPDRKVPILRD